MRSLTPPVARRFSSLAVLLIATGMPGDGISAQDPAKPSAKQEERQKLDEMKQVAGAFQVAVIDDQGARTPATMTPEPLHRWTDPTREFSGGALWAWRSSGRPVAIYGIELYGQSWSHEFVSLSTRKLRADDGRTQWAPSKTGIELREMPDASTPADDAAGRLRQMRDLARRLLGARILGRPDLCAADASPPDRSLCRPGLRARGRDDLHIRQRHQSRAPPPDRGSAAR